MRSSRALGSFVVVAMLSAACGDSVAPPEPTSVPTSLRVTPTVLSLERGETSQLSASIMVRLQGKGGFAPA